MAVTMSEAALDLLRVDLEKQINELYGRINETVYNHGECDHMAIFYRGQKSALEGTLKTVKTYIAHAKE